MAQPLSNPTDVNSEINAQDFMLRQFLGKHVFITLGQVVAVEGEFIDVRPMVMGVAADGSPVEHEVIYNLPVWRLQGGQQCGDYAATCGRYWFPRHLRPGYQCGKSHASGRDAGIKTHS